jgi:septal ring factor EnvC (AmiA/AmiB activator)
VAAVPARTFAASVILSETPFVVKKQGGVPVEKSRSIIVLGLAIAAGQLLFVRAQSSNSQGSSDDLVKEVRLIRIFLESSHKDVAKRDVLLERYRMQHEIVASNTDRLDAVRGELATVEADLTKHTTQINDLQALATTFAVDDVDHKAQVDAQLKDLQYGLDDLKVRRANLGAQEGRLASVLAVETTKLRSFEQALDAIVTSQ